MPATPNSDVHFHAIEGAEPFFRYGLGGYHPLAIGDRLDDRYRVLHKLGHGSYSTVWLARDEKLHRLVAVKVCTPDDVGQRECEVLALLSRSDVARDGNDSNDGASGRGVIQSLIDTFRVDGPFGTHTCLVTDVARCSMTTAKDSWPFLLMLPTARAIAAQLILAVAYLHSKGFVHGDLHLGNVLLRLPQEFSNWTTEELLARCGKPELQPVQTFDNKPIPPGVPTHAILPICFPMERTSRLPLSEARIILADFGEAYRPSDESRLVYCTPEHCRPPESRFEPKTPKSFSGDVWTLACCVFSVLAERGLFETSWCTEDNVAWLQVQTLGKMPDEWWGKWDARSKYFTEEGVPLPSPGSPVYTFDYQVEDTIQSERRRQGMQTMDLVETQYLLAMLRPMLAYRPEERCTVQEVLRSDWMTKYSMPDYEEMLRLCSVKGRCAAEL